MVVGPEQDFLEGDIMRNKDYIGRVNCSEVQSLVELFVGNILVIK